MLTPLLLVIACETITLQSISAAFLWIGAHPLPVLATYGILLLALLAVWGIIRRLGLSIFLTALLPVGVTLVSYYKTVINGEPLAVTDFSLAGNAGDVASFAVGRITVSGATGLALVLTALAVVLGALWTRFGSRPTVQQGGGITGGALLTLALCHATVLSPYFSYNAQVYATQAGRDQALGVPLSLLSVAMSAGVSSSEEYSAAYMEYIYDKMLEEYSAAETDETKPHIIYVMNESFFDVTRLPGLTFSEDPLKNYHRLAEEHQSGRFYTITAGGGTGWVEMEVFTGVPSTMLAANRANTDLPAELYEKIPSYVKVLKQNGYDTIGFHAHTNELYNRAENFPRIGFDEMHFVEEYAAEGTYTGKHFDDASSAKVIEKLFEEHRENPTFLYVMTMQNHQPYYGGRYEEHPVTVESDLLTEEELEVLQCYVTGLVYADRMLGELTDYFSQVDEPVVLAFSGDHLGSLFLSETETVYTKLGYVTAANSSGWTVEDQEKMFSTDYLLYTNDHRLEPGERKDVGCSMMAAELLAAARVDPTPYFAWLHTTGQSRMTFTMGDLKIDAAGQLTQHFPIETEEFIQNWKDVIYDLLYGETFLAKSLVVDG